MGRVLLLILIIVAVILLWKAFGPGTWNRQNRSSAPEQPAIKGPDDDEDFLWRLEKDAFKQRREKEAQERAAREEEERRRRREERGEPEA
ncbi:hypothetical protein [Corynebacterium guangdongense]|uniref:Secreted protein n=1 Tax=Corynebacterium guangdongense TaxID=1783348 RepID=A0ABU1ZU41_9CORY|nr:hypothetical protein [Corynebacterium guangdongense]MDR7328449.1 hypothetical protein [Corynebacterium guangdongense]WJZ17026.1 hypothetical protein CGUA_02130 [Corynebacterium guangdongense]